MATRVNSTKQFLEALAPHLLAGLRPSHEFARFTRNPTVVGAYIESAVRELIRGYVAPLRVSTGAVIDEADEPYSRSLPQLDTIIWTPSPVPAVFQAGEFALVPRSSVIAVLEVKSSGYDLDTLDRRLNSSFIRRVTADRFPAETSDFPAAALGVICVRMPGVSNASIERMRNASRVVVLFDRVGDAYKPREKEIYRLVNLLAAVHLRARIREGLVGINLDALK